MGELIQFPKQRHDVEQSIAELHQRQIENAAIAIAECGLNHPITKDAIGQLSEDQLVEAMNLSEEFIKPPEAS